MRFFQILSILYLIFFTGCESKEIRISISSWIGYTPIIYANEKGWLNKSNIKIYPVVSLGESVNLYKAGIIDGFAGTQREFFLANSTADLKTAILINRSNGADTILSNLTLDELKNRTDIETYLEIDSINKFILDSFIKEHKLNIENFNLNNKEQCFIVTLKPSDVNTLIVTYEPYSTILENSGFKKISSTKDINLLILDALFVDSDILEHHRDKIILLKRYINRAIYNLNSNPKEFYNVVKAYLEGQTYEEFISSLNGIEWLNKNISKELRAVIESNQISLKRVVF